MSGEMPYCLQHDLVRQPLLVKARRVHRLLDVQSVIDHAHQHVGDGGDDGRSAGRAKHEEQLAVLQHDGRRHRRQRTLVRAHRVRRPLNQSVHVGHALLDGEVVHLVVHQEAQALGGHVRSEAVVQRGGHRYRVALGIDHRVVRRVLWLAHALRLRDARWRTDRAW